MLALLLLVAGEKPAMLVHGQDKAIQHLVVIRLDAALAADQRLAAGAFRLGRDRWLPLPLESGLAPGVVPASMRTASGAWTASIAIQPFVCPATP